jgi:hypothetical protein
MARPELSVRDRTFEWTAIWPGLVLAAIAPLNFLGIWILSQSWQVGVAPDFQQYAAALERFLDGLPLYGPDWKWRYSPVALLTLGPVLVTGLVGWTILHVAAAALIRPWWLAALFVLSWPFWVDVVSGNTATFVAVAGISAIQGSRTGLYAYWWLTLIMPRPMQIPLAFYLFWTRPEARRGLLVLTAVNVGLVLIVGHGMEWVSYLLTRGAENMNEVFNIHPAADLLWLIVGIPLAVLLTLIGWPGQAGVILWPSLLPQYLLMAFVPPDRRRKIR